MSTKAAHLALVRAREVLSSEDKWANSFQSINADHDCLTTAIGQDYEAHMAFCAANGLDSSCGAYSPVIWFNDNHTYAQVMAALNKAIRPLSSTDQEETK